MDSISNIFSGLLAKIDSSKANTEIVNNLFKTSSNLLKYIKKGYANYNKSSSSVKTSEETMIGYIDNITDIGFSVIPKTATRRRILAESV